MASAEKRATTLALVALLGVSEGVARGARRAGLSAHAPPRLVARRRALSAGAALALASTAPQHAAAWCGSPFPSWAYYLQWDELTSPIGSSSSSTQPPAPFRRIVGDVRKERTAAVSPVVTMPLPGFGYSYFENLEAMTVSDRRIVELNGEAASPPTLTPGKPGSAELAPTLAPPTLAAYAATVAAVCRSLEAPSGVHLVAHGLAAEAALVLLEEAAKGDKNQPPLVRSLTLVSPYGALDDLTPSARQKLTSAAAAESGKGGSLVGRELLPVRLSEARQSCIADSISSASPTRGGGASLERSLDATLLGEAPRALGGGLGGAGLGRRLAGLGDAMPPTYLTYGGTNDLVATDWAELPRGVTVRRYASSGHVPFVDEPEEFVRDLLDFLDGVDGVKTNRELKFTNPLKGY